MGIKADWLLFVFCGAALFVSILVVCSPVKVFRLLNFGRPVPLLEKRPWLQTVYRVLGILVIIGLIAVVGKRF
jgi:hypothetical protein